MNHYFNTASEPAPQPFEDTAAAQSATILRVFEENPRLTYTARMIETLLPHILLTSIRRSLTVLERTRLIKHVGEYREGHGRNVHVYQLNK